MKSLTLEQWEAKHEAAKKAAKKAAKAKAPKLPKDAQKLVVDEIVQSAQRKAKAAKQQAKAKKLTKQDLAKPLVVQLEHAFSFFNGYLFDGKLPMVVFVTARTRSAHGHFWSGQWKNGDKEFHEINMNPEAMKGRPLKETLSTLVHEMVHLQHHEEGTAPKRVYHNKRWATLMMDVGLHPSTTGKPGGKTVGVKCSHYIIEGGAFDRAADQLIKDGFTLDWFAKPTSAEDKRIAKQKRDSNTKYTCPCCQANAWAKPGTHLVCGEDDTAFEAEED